MIIWIASYPKSGNTWIRSLLSSYIFSDDGDFSFKLLENIERFSVKSLSENIDKSHNNQDIVSRNWILNQEIINKDQKIHFLKTHNALCTINGNKFTDKNNTAAAIYIVRDPRNLITSLAHHYELKIDEAFDFMTNKRKIIFPETNKKNEIKDFNFIGNWSDHYKSWKNINFCPILIIKYEDLISEPKKKFISILNFISRIINISIDQNKIDKSILSTSFDKLSIMEKKVGFEESVMSKITKKKIKFFNLGTKNNWKTLLDKNLIKKIETNFKDEMNELGYL